MPKFGRKWVAGFVITSIVFVVGTFVAPFLGCYYQNHRFESFVRLQIEAADCQKTIPGQSNDRRQCFLAFDGVRAKSSIDFIGTGLNYSYNSEHNLFQVAGEGEIKDAKNSINLRSGHIFVNGEQLPVRSTPLRVLLKSDGHLVNEFCDVSP